MCQRKSFRPATPEWTYLLVQEFQIRGALIRDVSVCGSLRLILLGPLHFAAPVVLLIILVIFVVESKVRLLGGLLTV